MSYRVIIHKLRCWILGIKDCTHSSIVVPYYYPRANATYIGKSGKCKNCWKPMTYTDKGWR